MDEVIEVFDIVADSGFEGVLTWLLRLLGLAAVIAGFGLWLWADVGFLVLPGLLIVAGVVLLVAPTALLFLAEIAE